MSQRQLDRNLETWNAIRKNVSYEEILLGNGASRAVWPQFQYDSLFEVACSREMEFRLRASERALFRRFKTKNFELVLVALRTTYTVNSLLDIDTDKVEERYARIQNSLIEAVKKVHIPWPNAVTVLPALKKALIDYQSVFTTNYDLLVYWAIMSGESVGNFADFFWDAHGQFDPFNVTLEDGKTGIYYLHGALHLLDRWEGGTRKRINTGVRNLLNQFQIPDIEEGDLPLFITEGTSADKLKAIESSDYLSFAYDALREQGGNLVIFGQGLGENDRHLIRAISSSPRRNVAVSIFEEDPDLIEKRKHYVRRQFPPRISVTFFKASSHPLGSEKVAVS